MTNIILTESELKLKMAQIYKEEKLLQLKETWETFSKNEKVFVLEFYKAMHPESKLLQESKWYNWVGDIIGFIPGLELVNVINGVSYWKQGEKLFAILSFLAGIPGLGLVLGPVKTLLKGGGAVAKGFKGAVAAGDAAKLASIGKKSGIIGKLIGGVGSWGVKLFSMLEKLLSKVPFLKTIIAGIKSVVRLFGAADDIMVKSASGVKYPTKVPQSNVVVPKGGTTPLNKVGKAGEPKGMKADPITSIMSSMFGGK
jgi:hypothetical protein